MKYDRGDSIHFNSEPNVIQFGSKMKRKLFIYYIGYYIYMDIYKLYDI